VKVWKKYLIGLGVALVALQLVPLDRENPPVTQDVGAPPEVDRLLRRACYDCHSNEVDWPWYAWVAPVSFVVTQDVAGARHHVNFSEWDRVAPDFRHETLEEAYEEAAHGEMPPWQYRLGHPDAALSPAELEVLRAWVGVEPGDDHGGGRRGRDDDD